MQSTIHQAILTYALFFFLVSCWVFFDGARTWCTYNLKLRDLSAKRSKYITRWLQQTYCLYANIQCALTLSADTVNYVGS
jgi:hypothetical protein